MRPTQLVIPGVDGRIAVRTSFWGRSTLIADGRVVPRGADGSYVLPAEGGGTVHARLRRSVLQLRTYPDLVVDGVAHRAGPEVPLWVRLTAFGPVLLLVIGGLLGGVLAVFGVLANLVLIRSEASLTVRAAAVVAVTVTCVLAWFLGAVVVVAAAG